MSMSMRFVLLGMSCFNFSWNDASSSVKILSCKRRERQARAQSVDGKNGQVSQHRRELPGREAEDEKDRKQAGEEAFHTPRHIVRVATVRAKGGEHRATQACERLRNNSKRPSGRSVVASKQIQEAASYFSTGIGSTRTFAPRTSNQATIPRVS